MVRHSSLRGTAAGDSPDLRTNADLTDEVERVPQAVGDALQHRSNPTVAARRRDTTELLSAAGIFGAALVALLILPAALQAGQLPT